MLDSILTIIIYGFLPLTFVVLVAMLGTLGRMKLANRIMKEAKRGAFQGLSRYPQSTKIRLLAALALLSIIGVSILTFMILSGGISRVSSPVLISYAVLASVGSLAGAFLYKEIVRRIK